MDSIVDWLSSTSADMGLTQNTQKKFSKIMNNDEAFQVFIDAILDPEMAKTSYESLGAARSYRALLALKEDMATTSQGGTPIFMSPTRAGLLAKQVFASLEPPAKGILMHKRVLLDALLEAYPAAVVAAASAGGKDGLEEHLGPLMLFENCSQTLPTLTSLVVYGCTGKNRRTSTEHRPAASMPPQIVTKHNVISHGHRRKFVRSLTEWNLLERLAWWIVEEDDNDSPVGLGEEACETLLTIVECVGYPHPDADENEEEAGSVGEEMLLAPLGNEEYWEPLVSVLADPETQNESARVAAARAIVGILGLATGKSPRIRRSAAPAVDETEDIEEPEVQPEENEDEAMFNKLRDWGLTRKIHKALIAHLPRIINAMTMDDHKFLDEDYQATIYIKPEGSRDKIPPTAVRHPGHCFVVPFTSWRLQIAGVLAQLLSYEDGNDSTDGKESPRAAAMSALMQLPVSPQLQKKGEDPSSELGSDQAINPWPSLVGWIFLYPENCLYHVEFLRMFQAICLEHHEETLRLVLQKAKFVSRAIRSCKAGGSLQGILLICLNTLRLRSQSLPPSAFLRQFLESHDAWKGFQDELTKMTLAQQRPADGPAVPGQEKASMSSGLGLDLGSRYASQLGFEGMKAYDSDPTSSDIAVLVKSSSSDSGSGGKKKKKRKKKNKQQPVSLEQKEKEKETDEVSEESYEVEVEC
jgi:hypothetical protein